MTGNIEEVERQCQWLRERISQEGYPVPRDTARLLEALEDRLTVRVAAVPIAYTLLLPEPPAIVTLPAAATLRERDTALLEEIGHVLLHPDVPGISYLGTPAHPRLLARMDARAEAEANAFVLAWRLPLNLVRVASVEEVLAESGCSLEEVRRRKALIVRW